MIQSSCFLLLLILVDTKHVYNSPIIPIITPSIIRHNETLLKLSALSYHFHLHLIRSGSRPFPTSHIQLLFKSFISGNHTVHVPLQKQNNNQEQLTTTLLRGNVDRITLGFKKMNGGDNIIRISQYYTLLIFYAADVFS